MKRVIGAIVAGALCAIVTLTGCNYRTSEEDQAARIKQDHIDAWKISGLSQPFHPDQVSPVASARFGGLGSDAGEYRARRLDFAYWYEEKALEHVIHGNQCPDWGKWNARGIPLTGKDEQWAFFWIDKRNDEMAKPAAKQNLREAMQYDDGRTVYVHCQTYR